LLEEEKIVDLVAGPDAYRDLPKLLAQVDEGDKAVNTFLSREETYGDITPVSLELKWHNRIYLYYARVRQYVFVSVLCPLHVGANAAAIRTPL
jgi:hypothetical protein